MTDLKREVLLKCTLNFEKHDALKISEFTENKYNTDSKIYLMGSICAVNESFSNIESLQKEIAELKSQLEIAKNALKEINVSDSDISGNWISAYHLRDYAKDALKQLETTGE
jgi:hypothetical protein